MIAPVRPCAPDCPGYRIARPLGVAIAVRCPACWSGAPLAPDSSYYARQPEPRDELAFSAALERPSRCLRCREPASFGHYMCEICMDRADSERRDAREDVREQ